MNENKFYNKLKKSHFLNLCKHFAFILSIEIPISLYGYNSYSLRPLFSASTFILFFIFIKFQYAGIFIIIIFTLLNIVYYQSAVYYFNAYDFFKSIAFLSELNFNFLKNYKFIFNLSLIILYIFYIIIILKYFYIKVRQKYSFIYIALCGIFILSLDIINGSSYLLSRRDNFMLAVNIAGSAEYSIFKDIENRSNFQKIRPVRDNQSVILNFNFVDWARHNEDRSIFFVIVESFGLPKSQKAMWWLKKIPNIEGYKTIYNEIAFKGATTSGELRSLCALEGHYANINKNISSNCLPARLVKDGWRTSGLHGFSGHMFDRNIWWRHIGLENVTFDESPNVRQLPRCGNIFRGVCDKDLLQVAFRQTYQPRSFIYLLSLNTHLPVENAPVPSDLTKICTQDSLPIEACMHIASLGRLLTNVTKEASTAYKRPLIVIVGDHAPPFAMRGNRDLFRQDKVPSFILVPK